MRFIPILSILSLPLALVACHKADPQNDSAEDTEISLDFTGENGANASSSSSSAASSSAASASSGTGERNASTAVATSSNGDSSSISINSDGLKMNVRVPSFDIDPVSGKSEGLYPGSKVTGLNVNSNSDNGAGSSRVELRFTAPASPEKVADWFEKKFRKDGAQAALSGNTLTGTTEDGDPFILTLKPDGIKTRGVMNVTQ